MAAGAAPNDDKALAAVVVAPNEGNADETAAAPNAGTAADVTLVPNVLVVVPMPNDGSPVDVPPAPNAGKVVAVAVAPNAGKFDVVALAPNEGNVLAAVVVSIGFPNAYEGATAGAIAAAGTAVGCATEAAGLGNEKPPGVDAPRPPAPKENEGAEPGFIFSANGNSRYDHIHASSNFEVRLSERRIECIFAQHSPLSSGGKQRLDCCVLLQLTYVFVATKILSK